VPGVLVFCGWRLIESQPNLLKLGSGTLEIDAITGQCVFQGKTTGQLTIAEEIRAWLQQDLAQIKSQLRRSLAHTSL
jgi:hypothetical protein